MAYRMDTVVKIRIECDYEKPEAHQFVTDLMGHRGPLVCPVCGKRYKAFGGYTVELMEDEHNANDVMQSDAAPENKAVKRTKFS